MAKVYMALFWLVLLNTGFQQVEGRTFSCVAPCRCYYWLWKLPSADCNDHNLTSIPKFSTRVKEMLHFL